MPIGKLSDTDRQRLDDHFWAIVRRACFHNDCRIGAMLNRHAKSHGGKKGVTAARHRIVKEMRDTVRMGSGTDGRLLLTFCEHRETVLCSHWKRISFKRMAEELGVEYSALVTGQKSLKENRHGRRKDDS